jgi:KDO2-lipid IV(A) lauroyltransferase
MYYILFLPLYLVSLLPFIVLYRVSDLIFLIMYHMVGYRRKVVMKNLELAFPEKSLEERKKIAVGFYRRFADSMVETIKLLSISEANFRKRVQMNYSSLSEQAKSGRNFHVFMMHQMNWEFGNQAFALNAPAGLSFAVYQKINSPAFDRLMLHIRKRFGANLVSAHGFRNEAQQFMKGQYSFGLLADQSPPSGGAGYWLYFMGTPAPFVMGPDKSSRRLNPVIVFLNAVRVRRGYYRFESTVVETDAGNWKEGEFTRKYRDFMERCIRENPSNYLWSHRRWKHQYQTSYRKNWIDEAPPPES